jgi:fumarate reductase flavoprotein subunit
MSDYDLVAIGGGLAGMTAAARAAELGARVAVIEKGLDDDYPCNTRVSGGVIHVAQHDVKLPEEELRAIATKETAGFSEPELLEALVKDTRRAIDFLRGRGANFVRGYNRNWVLAPPRPSVNNLVWKGLGNDRTLKLLAKGIRGSGGSMLLGHRAEELMMRDGTCHGVVATVDGGRVEIAARAVVIADGGFHANPDLLRQHIGPHPERIFARNAGQSQGDGLKMAVAAGAETTPLDRFYGHLLSIDAFRNPELWPYPQMDLVALSGIVVDKSGRRLFDEGLGGIHAANFLAGLDDPMGGIVVCDAAQWEAGGQEALIPPNPRLERAGGTLHAADSIAVLARAAGIDADALTETVRNYNAAVAADRLSAVQPPRSSHKMRPTPIVKTPFRAIPICAGITNMMGGLRIDVDGRVRKAGGGTIAGLYAAGAATGGLEGGPNVVYVGGLCRAAVFGIRAAEHAMKAA